jgi:hypothetical protein
MNDPAASSGVSSSLLGRHSVLDRESSRVFWIPAFAGMTNSRQAAENAPEGIQSIARIRNKPGTYQFTVEAKNQEPALQGRPSAALKAFAISHLAFTIGSKPKHPSSMHNLK